jgi:hypothetical protein
MNRKNSLIVGGLIGIVLVLITVVFITPITIANGTVHFDTLTPEAAAISTAIIDFKGITLVAAYNYISYEINWKLFKKDNSYEKGTYSQSNEYIQNWANDVKKNYPLNNNTQKGEAVFNYTYYHIVTKWHLHDNTACSIQDVAEFHEANCAETSRIVYNLALAVGIPPQDVRYVHSALQHHYWVQIHCDGNWTNVDASHAADDTYHINKFGLSEPASDVQPISENQLA